MASQDGAMFSMQQLWDEGAKAFEDFLIFLDNKLYNKRPSGVLLLTVVGTILFSIVLDVLLKMWRELSIAEVKQSSFGLLRYLPFVENIIKKEKQKIQDDVTESIRAALPGESLELSLPSSGCESEIIVKRLVDREKKNVQVAHGHSTVSGTVYMQGEDLEKLLNQVYGLFSTTNPLHADVFPSVRLMESEVVSMTASILGGGTTGVNSVCGAMTGGGTESILMAVKASRDFMKKTKGIGNPHMVIAQSAHAAYWKAAEYFGIRLTVVPVDKNYQLNPKSVKRELTTSTILVVASAYGYPHGIIDPIPQIAKVTRNRGICLHVDGCLGGFVLPFAAKLGHPIPSFDFSVEGVTSMSVDTHKYGMAHKGTSVVLYRTPELRRFQYTRISEWTGGLYISPGMPGSRSGGVIATAWASLIYHGIDGYMAITEDILEAADHFRKGLQTSCPELEVIGDPLGSVIAFGSTTDDVNIYKVHDLMLKKGWHLNSLQYPAALHMCFTGRHKDIVDNLLKDLASCIDDLKKDPNCVKGGSAAIYGATCSLPDRRIVGELLEIYQDTMLTP